MQERELNKWSGLAQLELFRTWLRSAVVVLAALELTLLGLPRLRWAWQAPLALPPGLVRHFQFNPMFAQGQTQVFVTSPGNNP